MKNKLSISIIFLIVFCYCNYNSSELPSRKQKNWCISNADIVQRTSEINENQKIILKDLYEAEQIYFKSTGIEVSFFQFQNKLLKGDEDILKICAIWADMNEVN
tara:strand:- start:35 stop:346 length:312 start_codon:yes stop_codon:yes gene_type:complete